MLLRFLSIVMASVQLTVPAFAQVSSAIAPSVPASQVDLSSTALEELTNYVQTQVDEGHIAGAVMLVARHGRIAYAQPVGFSNLASESPMRRDQLFRIASMTKTVTSVAILQLVEEGKLRLEDSVADFIPALANPSLFASAAPGQTAELRSPTIHELLTHTSGLTYGWFGPPELDAIYERQRINDLFVPIDETIGKRVARLQEVPLVAPPGAAWNYSFSLDVLGHVVEVVSGLSLEQYFQTRIFRPLGMHDTYFFVPPEAQARLATLYTLDDQQQLMPVTEKPVERGFLRFNATFCTERGEEPFYSGGGGLVSTADDYLRFLLMLSQDGELEGTRILKASTTKRMTQNQIGELEIPFPGHGDGFGYGFGVLTPRGKANDVASVGTYSWGGIFNTYYWVDPQQELIGVLMTQLFPYDHLDLRDEFKRRVYQAIDDSGFSQLYRYQPGLEFGNPVFNSREIRVNSPAASTHPTFATRPESRSSGTARIQIEEDLRKVDKATVYCELWGGHPGTANKRLSINGRSTYLIPEVGCADGHCTHQYPRFTIPPTDLVNGYNSLQFACDQGSTFWGHFIVDGCTIEMDLPEDDPRIVELAGDSFKPLVEVAPDSTTEKLHLQIEAPSSVLRRIDRVDYWGHYYGYDENGSGNWHDWHGMTKDDLPYGHLGSSNSPPFQVVWDTRMLPAQKNVSVRAVVHFEAAPDLIYRTATTDQLSITKPADRRVEFVRADDLPTPFWSRAGRVRTCHFHLPVAPEQIEACQLHTVSWTGGAGSVTEYFHLNDSFFPVAEGNAHEVQYSVHPVPVESLRPGRNQVQLLSDTEHHGIEILAPGPTLVIRYRTP